MQLNYKVFGEGFPLIILHGLLGSLDNWQTIAKKLAETSLTTYYSPLAVYILNQRNHGRSPHSDEFNYQLLSNDLLDFIEQHQISKAHLIGHSMGGKTAMKFALEHSEKVEKLIVVDIAPVRYGNEGSEVLDALLAADIKHAASREEVEKVLMGKLNSDITIVQFLMKGLQRSDERQTGFRWKFNLESLRKNFDKISEAVSADKSFQGETLFIKGEKSGHISSSNYDSITQLFPRHQLIEIKGVGHWVHAEKPDEFIQEVMKFLM